MDEQAERAQNFVRSSIARSAVNAISDPRIYLDERELPVREYYNRGRWRFVYRDGDKVIKVFRVCSPFNKYFGEFYDLAKKKAIPPPASLRFFERITFRSSQAITRLEEETYSEVRAVIPDRIVETQYGILKKTKFGVPYFRPYSIQPFVKGCQLTDLARGERIIRDLPVDDSLESLAGIVLDFNRADKKEVLAGIEEFLMAAEQFYAAQSAVLDLNPTNLIVTDDGLKCYDLQKFHKSLWRFESEHSPLDTIHILRGMLEVNQ
jgi:hypothetical protein